MSGLADSTLTRVIGLAALAAAACSTNSHDAGGGGGGMTGTTSPGGGSGTGGVVGAGGVIITGGVSGSGGGRVAGTGGQAGGGGATASGGRTGTGGGPGSGGSSGTGGTSSVDGGAGTCKRGIAANTAPGAPFYPAVTWWYNWAAKGSGPQTGIEFVPMLWGSGSLNATIPSGSQYLLTFNEPNFKAQADLTAAQAASYWPTIQSKAAGLPIVGPGMNFCGPADQCNGTDPYQYLTDFFAACTGCQVDYVAVHWYNCDLPSLKDYLEPGGNLAGFEQFGKPIWLTEFSCDTSASVAQQETYMRAAIPYLEGNPKVFRYSWFSADPIPNAKLINSDGSPTALGQVYISLPQSCP
jgi:hypothetical protein